MPQAAITGPRARPGLPQTEPQAAEHDEDERETRNLRQDRHRARPRRHPFARRDHEVDADAHGLKRPEFASPNGMAARLSTAIGTMRTLTRGAAIRLATSFDGSGRARRARSRSRRRASWRRRRRQVWRPLRASPDRTCVAKPRAVEPGEPFVKRDEPDDRRERHLKAHVEGDAGPFAGDEGDGDLAGLAGRPP
jgi:hypothetical protein